MRSPAGKGAVPQRPTSSAGVAGDVLRLRKLAGSQAGGGGGSTLAGGPGRLPGGCWSFASVAAGMHGHDAGRHGVCKPRFSIPCPTRKTSHCWHARCESPCRWASSGLACILCAALGFRGCLRLLPGRRGRLDRGQRLPGPHLVDQPGHQPLRLSWRRGRTSYARLSRELAGDVGHARQRCLAVRAFGQAIVDITLAARTDGHDLTPAVRTARHGTRDRSPTEATGQICSPRHATTVGPRSRRHTGRERDQQRQRPRTRLARRQRWCASRAPDAVRSHRAR
jgi:hypothetical protein